MSQRFADPKLRFHELAVRTLLPRRKPGTYLKPNLHLPANRPRITAYAPSILPIVRPKAGYAYFETRTVTTKHRRKWYPNYRPHTLPAQILGGQQTTQGNSMLLSPMRLRMEDVSEIEAAGGVEPFLIHTPGHKLSDHGKIYRQHLFQELNRMRDTGEWYAGPSRGRKWVQLPRESQPAPSVGTSGETREESSGSIGQDTPQHRVEQAEEERLMISSSGRPRDIYGPGRHGIRAGGFSTTRLKTDEEIGRNLKRRDEEKAEVAWRKTRRGGRRRRGEGDQAGGSE